MKYADLLRILARRECQIGIPHPRESLCLALNRRSSFRNVSITYIRNETEERSSWMFEDRNSLETAQSF